MKLISSIFSSLESDAWWNIDIKFHFHFEFFVSRFEKGRKGECLMIERFEISFDSSSGSAEGSKVFRWIGKYFQRNLVVFFEVTFLTTSRSSSRFPFIPLSTVCKQPSWGVRETSDFFIVYYTLSKWLCLFIVFLSFFTTNTKRIQKKDENKVFCLHYKKALQRLFFLLQSLRCYVSFSSSPFRASFIIVLARRHHLCVV
jgi:hypothetical protein